MKQIKGHDYSTIIIWASALVGMIRYAAAFLSSDLGMITGDLSVLVTWMLGISGFFMGILGTFGTVYIFDGWRQKMPKTGDPWNNKFMALTLFVFLAFLAEVLILVPFTMSRVLHVSVADVLDGGVWWWSTAVVVMPLLLIGGVSVGNQIVSVASANVLESSPNVRGDEKERSENVRGDWRKVRPYLSGEEVMAISRMSTADIKAKFYLNTDKTAQNWRKKAQAEVIEMAKVQA